MKKILLAAVVASVAAFATDTTKVAPKAVKIDTAKVVKADTAKAVKVDTAKAVKAAKADTAKKVEVKK